MSHIFLLILTDVGSLRGNARLMLECTHPFGSISSILIDLSSLLFCSFTLPCMPICIKTAIKMTKRAAIEVLSVQVSHSLNESLLPFRSPPCLPFPPCARQYVCLCLRVQLSLSLLPPSLRPSVAPSFPPFSLSLFSLPPSIL